MPKFATVFFRPKISTNSTKNAQQILNNVIQDTFYILFGVFTEYLVEVVTLHPLTLAMVRLKNKLRVIRKKHAFYRTTLLRYHDS